MAKISPIFAAGLAVVALVALGLGVYVALRPAGELAILDENSLEGAEPTATPFQSLGDQVYAEAVETPEPAPSAAIADVDDESSAAATLVGSDQVMSKDEDDPVSGNLDTSGLFDL